MVGATEGGDFLLKPLGFWSGRDPAERSVSITSAISLSPISGGEKGTFMANLLFFHYADSYSLIVRIKSWFWAANSLSVYYFIQAYFHKPLHKCTHHACKSVRGR
jgi:esterase/lipase superfamily enzyme